MEKQHLTYFKIENFKRFDSFEMSNLGQFNLIVGDNNVGKTSVLEALLFDEDIKILLHDYLSVLFNREGQDFFLSNKDIIPSQQRKYWEFMFKDTESPIHISAVRDSHINITIEIFENEELSQNGKVFLNEHRVSSIIPDIWISVSNHSGNDAEIYNTIDTIKKTRSIQYLPFIPANSGYSNDLIEIFFEYFNANKKARLDLVNSLKLLVPDVEDVKVHRFNNDRDMIGLSLINHDDLTPLTRYGDGTIKITKLLMKIWAVQNKRLMVDEIGAGIHFTRLKDYWKTIIQLCAKYNVQLFSTTHSLECQQAFIEALDDPEMQQHQKDARNISLIENKQGEVKAVTYDFNQFEYALTIGFNTRGGTR